MDVLTKIFAFLLTVLVLVSIHEAGHMLVARLLKIKVLRYSIGFGKPLWKRTAKSGIEYVIGFLPLGGYVKLLDERDMIVSEADKPYAFNRQPLWARTAVVAAGPLTNILFAILCYWVIFSIGFESMRPVVGKVLPGTALSQSGLPSGSELLKVDGKPVNDWQDVVFSVIDHMGGKGQMTFDTRSKSGELGHYSVNVSEWKVDPLKPDPLNTLGVEPFKPDVPAVIEAVTPEGPGAAAGLRSGDKIVAVDGKPIKDWYQFVEIIQPHPGQKFSLTIDRAGETLTIPVTPESKVIMLGGVRKIGMIGVQVHTPKYPASMKYERKYSPLMAWLPASQETLRFFAFNFTALKKMVMGELSLQSLGGPITIFRTADSAFKEGVGVYVRFLALVSIMLAFVNVLPIPGLDGGHILYFLMEFILRRPLSQQVEILTMRIGMLLLLLLTLLVTYNDILRLLK